MGAQHDKGKNWVDGKTVKQVGETDGSYSEQVAANLMAWDATAGAYVKLTVDHPTGSLNVLSGGGGGGAVTIADGANIAQGSTTDLSTANTVVGILKAIKAAVQGTLTVATHAVTKSGTWPLDTAAKGTTAAGSPTSGALDANTQPLHVSLKETITQPVSGTFFQATQPVSLATNTPDVTDRAARLLGVVDKGKVWDGTNIAAVKAASALAVATDPAFVVQHAPQRADASTLWVTAISAANTTVTLTLPAAAAGLFHYITHIEIVNLNPTVTAIAAAATTLSYTTTNLPGSPAFSCGNLLAAGGTFTVANLSPSTPIKSSVAATNTTFVAPAIGTGGLCRMNVIYYTAP